jgi:hypothetical protein
MNFELVVKASSFCILEKKIEFVVIAFDAIVELDDVGVFDLFHDMDFL